MMQGTPELWNFAYGGNMNPRVLSGRRKIRPLESVAGVLEGYRLVFNTRGFPWLEPVFANVEPCPGESVHGVLHRLTPGQFRRLDRYEGGGLAYTHLELEVSAYDGRKIRARVYLARRVSRPKAPSCRYLDLLRQGARHHGLDPHYLRKLDLQPCRNTPGIPECLLRFFERGVRLFDIRG